MWLNPTGLWLKQSHGVNKLLFWWRNTNTTTKGGWGGVLWVHFNLTVGHDKVISSSTPPPQAKRYCYSLIILPDTTKNAGRNVHLSLFTGGLWVWLFVLVGRVLIFLSTLILLAPLLMYPLVFGVWWIPGTLRTAGARNHTVIHGHDLGKRS